VKNYKDSNKKSYHELKEELEDKKGFSRSDLPRKRKEVIARDDEPMVSMARSESSRNRNYDDGDRKPYTPRSGGEFKKPYNKDGFDKKKPYTPRENSDKKTYTPREGSEKKTYPSTQSGYKKPYDPNRSYDSKKTFDKPYKKTNENR
jgi:hypothetical protein